MAATSVKYYFLDTSLLYADFYTNCKAVVLGRFEPFDYQ